MVRRFSIACVMLAGAAALLVAQQAAGQAGMTLLTDGTNMKNFDTAGNANWRPAERTITADRGGVVRWRKIEIQPL
jgi:hypothetical protein